MDDESIVKIMQTLGLNYDPAIKATEQFQGSIANLRKDLELIKSTATETAKNINKAFTAEFGNIKASDIKKMFDQIDKYNKPVEIKVITNKAEKAMNDFARSMGIKLDKNLKSQFSGLTDSILGDFDQAKFDELANNIADSYEKAMQKYNKQIKKSSFVNTDDAKIYDYLRKSTIKLDESTINAKKNVEGFGRAIQNLAMQSKNSGMSLDQMGKELEKMGVQKLGANTEDIAKKFTQAIESVRQLKHGFSDLGFDVPRAKIDEFVKDSLGDLITNLFQIKSEAMAANQSLSSLGDTSESASSKTKKLTESQKEQSTVIQEVIRQYKAGIIDAQKFVETASKLKVNQGEWSTLPDKFKKDQIQLHNQLMKAEKEHRRVLNEKSKIMDEINNKAKQSTLEKMKAQAASIQQRATTKKLSSEYVKQASTIRSQVQELQKKLQLEGKLSAEETKQTQQLQKQLETLKAQTNTAISDKIRKNPNFLGEEFQRRSSWFLTGTMFYGMINGAKKAHEAIKDVEMGMVEIARVMDDSSFVFEKYRDNLLQLGADYGQTFDNVQQIALRWAQSGYNVDDSLELTETSLLALNTAELDVQNATESMIGIMAQWQLQAEDLGLVMDKINKTADDYSITSQDLVDGLLRSSGAARVMNLSMEDTIGLLTVMREASGRTGQEVGNALNSILSYIQRPKAINMLESLGINMFTDEAKTQFRSVLDIFKDIAANWNTLSKDVQDGFVQSADDAELFNEELATALGLQEEWNDLQQRDIAQASAGVYRRNYFIGMIERLSNVQSVLNNMMDAEGYSMRENTKTMDTLEKKNQSLKASLEALAVAAGDAGVGGTFKALAQGGTSALNAINKMPKPMKDLTMATTSMFLAVKTLDLGMKTLGIKIPGVSEMIASLTSGTLSLTAAFKAAGTGLAKFVEANLPLLALSAAIGAIVAIANAIKKHREEQQKAIETASQNIQSLEKQKQGLAELASEYDTLKEKQQNLTATADEKKRLLEIQRELVDTYDVSIAGIDEEGRAYANSTIAIQERIEALEKEKALEMEKIETAVMAKDVDNVKQLEKQLDKLEKLEIKLKEADKKIKQFEELFHKGENLDIGGVQITPQNIRYKEKAEAFKQALYKSKQEIEKNIEDVNTAIEEGTADREKLLKNDAIKIVKQLSENGVEITDEARAFATELAKALSFDRKLTPTLRKELEEAIREFTSIQFDSSTFDEWKEKYNKALSEGNNEGIDKAANAIRALVREVAQGKPELDNFAIAMEGLYPTTAQMASATEKATDKVINLDTAMQNMGTTAKDTMNELKILNQAIYDVRHGQSLSIDTILDLIEKYDLSTDAIKKTTDGYTIEVSALEKVRNSKIKTAIDSINAEKDVADKTVRNVKKRIKAYGLEIEQIKNLAEAKTTLARAADTEARKKADAMTKMSSTFDPLGIMKVNNDPSKHAKLYRKYYDEEKRKINSDVSAYKNAVDELEVLDKRTNLLEGMLNDSSYGVVSHTPNRSKTKASKSTKYENEALNNALKILEHRKKIIEETQKTIQTEINELNRINKLYVKTTDERMNMTERIYSAEKRLRNKRLQDSVNWINEKKNLDQLSIEEEIGAWERVKKNQNDNIEARKQATLNLYKLKNQVMTESYAKEEGSIEHLTKLGIYSTEQQIEKYKELYKIKATSIEEERSRVENLFGLYKNLIKDQQKTVKIAYDERIKRIEEEAEKKKKVNDEAIKAIEKELELLDRKENEYDHDKKMVDLKEQLKYWQVRTSEDARKKVAELTKEIDEEEHDREVELKKQGLEDKKKILEDETKNINNSAKRQKEKWEKSYKKIEVAFDEHSIDMIALASTMSKGMYKEFKKNYLDKIEKALKSGNYGSVKNTLNKVDNFAEKAYKKTYDSKTAQIYRLASQIVELKKQYEYGDNKNAAQRALSIYNQLSKLRPSVANILHRSNYMTAKNYVNNLPKAHTGAKTLSYGAVCMKPGELIFPPDLSMKLENLIQVLYERPAQQVHTSSKSTTDKRIIQNFNAPLYNSEKTVFEDDIDEVSFTRELKRAITSIP